MGREYNQISSSEESKMVFKLLSLSCQEDPVDQLFAESTANRFHLKIHIFQMSCFGVSPFPSLL